MPNDNQPLTAKLELKMPDPIPKLSPTARMLFKDCFRDWWGRIDQEDRDRYIALVNGLKPDKQW
jgi:hypothetical protein